MIPEEYLDGEGKVDPQKKFAIDIPEYGIKASRVPAKADEKFDTLLFQPEGEGRQGEGGLRTRGYFKHGYKKVDGQWYIVDRDDNPVEPIGDEETESRFDIRHSALESLPLVTVITVVYNGEKYLEETIKSVLTQSYPNIEYIIIDGGSTDGTMEIIKKYEKYIDYWISELDNGIYDAMNKGIALGLGGVIGLINADDRYRDGILSKVMEKYCLNTPDIIYGDIRLVNNETDQLVEYRKASLKKLIFGMSLNHPATFISTVTYKKNGRYDTTYQMAADYDFLLKMYLENTNFSYLPEVLTLMRDGGESVRKASITSLEEKKAKQKSLPGYIFRLTEISKRISGWIKGRN